MRRSLSAFVFVFSCADTSEFIEAPPFEDGFLLMEGEGAPPTLRRISFKDPLHLSLAGGERAFLVSYDHEAVAALHPDLSLAAQEQVDLYLSPLDAAECPHGEAPTPGVRGYGLPIEAWRIFELVGEDFQAPRQAPSWLGQLRIRAPVSPACGLSNPRFVPSGFPMLDSGVLFHLERVDARRWISRGVYQSQITLLELEPARVIATVSSSDLGFANGEEPFTDMVVDTSTTPPRLILASKMGLVRVRIQESTLEFERSEFANRHIRDLEPKPGGGFVGVGHDGFIVRIESSSGVAEEIEGAPRMEFTHVRYVGAPGWNYLLGAGQGYLYFGDPLLGPESLIGNQVNLRSWRDLSVSLNTPVRQAFALETGTGIVRVRAPDAVSPLSQRIPPEVVGCGTPAPDACGFTPVDRTRAETVLVPRSVDATDPVVLLGLELCPAIVVSRPDLGCLGAFDVEQGPAPGDFLRLNEDSGVVYATSKNGPVYQWVASP